MNMQEKLENINSNLRKLQLWANWLFWNFDFPSEIFSRISAVVSKKSSVSELK